MTEKRIAQIILYQKHGFNHSNPQWKQKNWAELEPVLDSKLWKYDVKTLHAIANGEATK